MLKRAAGRCTPANLTKPFNTAVSVPSPPGVGEPPRTASCAEKKRTTTAANTPHRTFNFILKLLSCSQNILVMGATANSSVPLTASFPSGDARQFWWVAPLHNLVDTRQGRRRDP